jgi:uncharacterized lipoprotein
VKCYPILRILVTVAAAASLGACSWFHHRSDYYTGAVETRPLEVPPDLDTPPSANEMVVPQSGSSAARSSGGATAPPAVSSLGETDLHVADSVAGTWQRVGMALDRAKLGTVSARDENAHTYSLDFKGTVSTKPEGEHHWYSAVLHHLGFGEEDVSAKLTDQVVEDAGGARVSVHGGNNEKPTTEAAHHVAQVLSGDLATTAPVAASPVAPVSPAPAPLAAAPASAPPAMAAQAPASAGAASFAGADLHVTDSVQNTWQRVGLALERAQIGTLSGRDENAHTYTLEFNSTVETKPAETEHHWYTRILHPFGGGSSKVEQVKRSLTVRVGEDNGGARVSVEGDTSDKATADAAKRVLQVLSDRLS